MADRPTRVQAPTAERPVASHGLLPARRIQRACSCGGSCSSCQKRRREEGRRSPLAPLQAKLTLGPAHDHYEREADRVAHAVMRDPDSAFAPPAPPAITPLSIADGTVQARDDSWVSGRQTPEGTLAVPSGDGIAFASQVITSPGRPLPTPTLHAMSRRFGHDFSEVRIHDGAAAAGSAKALTARAFTVDRNVVFGAGEYDPASPRGIALLAHELTHIVQQGGVPRWSGRSRQEREPPWSDSG